MKNTLHLYLQYFRNCISNIFKAVSNVYNYFLLLYLMFGQFFISQCYDMLEGSYEPLSAGGLQKKINVLSPLRMKLRLFSF